MNTFKGALCSLGISLRLTELLSIIVIQRYNNIYSFVAVVWLTTVASVEKTRVIFWVTLVVLLPV